MITTLGESGGRAGVRPDGLPQEDFRKSGPDAFFGDLKLGDCANSVPMDFSDPGTPVDDTLIEACHVDGRQNARL